MFSLLPKNNPIWRHNVSSFSRVNPNTIGYMRMGEFDLNTLRLDGEIFESGKKKLRTHVMSYKILST